MADNKSKLPDFGEITSMASKFIKDIKTSISQIVEEYKAKHGQPTDSKPADSATVTTKVEETKKTETVVEAKPAEAAAPKVEVKTETTTETKKTDEPKK